MARVKRNRDRRQSTATMLTARTSYGLQSPLVLEMPDAKELGSPCPSPRRKRKRTNAVDIRVLPERPCTPPTVELRLSVANSPQIHRPPGSEAPSDVGPEKQWKSFTIQLCSCRDNHACHAHVLPASSMRSYASLTDVIESLVRVSCRQGVFTDLEGNEMYGLSRLFDTYMADGLPGVIWHDNYFSGVSLGDRRAAQHHIQTCLAKQEADRMALILSCSCKRENVDRPLPHSPIPQRTIFQRQSSEEARIDRYLSDNLRTSTVKRITTPPPLPPTPVMRVKEETPEPWTARTSSSTGQITQLENRQLGSTIRRQAMHNIFDEEECVRTLLDGQQSSSPYNWKPLTPAATSEMNGVQS